MNLHIYDAPFPLAVVENFYSQGELDLIHSELNLLLPELKNNPFESDFRVSDDVKRNNSLFLDNHYSGKREESSILKVNRKLFWLLEDMKGKIPESNWFFNNLTTSDDYTHISYYGEGDYFDVHIDYATITSLTWIYQQPKTFSGGNLIFPDYDITVECLYNKMIMFPGMIRHKVTPVSYQGHPGGSRWCITQFAHQRKL